MEEKGGKAKAEWHALCASHGGNQGLYVCARREDGGKACGNFTSESMVHKCSKCNAKMCWYCPLCNRVYTITYRSRHNTQQHSPEAYDTSSSSSPEVRQCKRRKKLSSSMESSASSQEDIAPRAAQRSSVNINANMTGRNSWWLPFITSVTPYEHIWRPGQVAIFKIQASAVPEFVQVESLDGKPIPITGRLPFVQETEGEFTDIQIRVPHPVIPGEIHIVLRNSRGDCSNSMALNFKAETVDPEESGAKVDHDSATSPFAPRDSLCGYAVQSPIPVRTGVQRRASNGNMPGFVRYQSTTQAIGSYPMAYEETGPSTPQLSPQENSEQ